MAKKKSKEPEKPQVIVKPPASVSVKFNEDKKEDKKRK